MIEVNSLYFFDAGQLVFGLSAAAAAVALASHLVARKTNKAQKVKVTVRLRQKSRNK